MQHIVLVIVWFKLKLNIFLKRNLCIYFPKYNNSNIL